MASVYSARGELVDFDLLTLKQQIGTAPKPVTVEERETFIDNKFKRKLNKQLETAVKNIPKLSEKATKEEQPNENTSDL